MQNRILIIDDDMDVPVLMITAKDDNESKVKGLQLGADDYLTKPFNLEEFEARVQSLIRRYLYLNDPEKRTIIEFKGLTIMLSDKRVLINDSEVLLSNKEKVIRNSVRTDGSLFTVIFPPDFFTSCCTIFSPIPLPLFVLSLSHL